MAWRKIAICLSLCKKREGSGAVFVRIVRLEDDLLVVIELEPFQPVKDRSRRFFGRPRQICVLDPKQKFAAGVTCIKIIKKRSARRSNMQVARWRRCKSHSYCHTLRL